MSTLPRFVFILIVTIGISAGDKDSDEDVGQMTYDLIIANISNADSTKYMDVEEESIGLLKEDSSNFTTSEKEEEKTEHFSDGDQELDLDEILDENVSEMTYDLINDKTKTSGTNIFDVVKEDSIDRSTGLDKGEEEELSKEYTAWQIGAIIFSLGFFWLALMIIVGFIITRMKTLRRLQLSEDDSDHLQSTEELGEERSDRK